jgi:TRAP-type mannitol/chloroaromatic compound transport system permease large subunit
VPALPAEARTLTEPDGSAGNRSLLVLVVVSWAIAFAFERWYYAGKDVALDERIIVTLCVAFGVAFLIASANRLLKLGLLSKLAERVTFVMIPPLALIFLVLGTIFLGIATPTEGGAMGATGALIMALSRRRLTFSLTRQAMESTAKLTAFVVFILVGARVFSLTFYGVDGHRWVEHLLSDLPGGQLGFLIVVNVLVFLLAFFLDFFELAFIVVPLLGPVAEKLGIDLIWFGVLLGVNMQTSFMHPPFGFALFYLRSVAPAKEYVDKITKKLMAPVTTGQIYWGAIPFVVIQCIMVGLVIAFPQMVMVYKDEGPKIDPASIQIEMTPYAPPAAEQDAPSGYDAPPGGQTAPKDGAAPAPEASSRDTNPFADSPAPAPAGALPPPQK